MARIDKRLILPALDGFNMTRHTSALQELLLDLVCLVQSILIVAMGNHHLQRNQSQESPSNDKWDVLFSSIEAKTARSMILQK